MQKSEKAAQARRELDRRFAAAEVAPFRARPQSGWIRAVRSGLGMSQDALAKRMGITSASVAKLEKNERNETISIGKLAEVARAMDCQLVYSLVPNESLEHTVRHQAERVASSTLDYVATTMGLEDQSVEIDRRAEQLADETQKVIAAHRLWPSE
jgi:predicted DNA-binding mobile mystery protein A